MSDDHPTTRGPARAASAFPTAAPGEMSAAATSSPPQVGTLTRVDTSQLLAGAKDVASVIAAVREALTGRHTTITTIGAGGMGTVELIADRALRRRAVMKRIHDHLERDINTVRMFVREAQVMGQLEHPNIVPVHELGVAADSTLYFTMKLVEGRTLEELVRGLGGEPLEHAQLIEMLETVDRVCDALAFAHSRGIVHLDVKPANVMVGDFGEVYLMDWGLARRIGGESDPESSVGTQSGAPVFVGTASYMAPEQALGRNAHLDERTDVFAVGAMIYQLLARRPPYTGEHFLALLAKAQVCEFPPLEEVAKDPVPRPLARIVARAMAFDPDERYPSITELQADIMRFVRGGESFPQTTFQPGEAIVREGEPGDTAYILKTGRCEVSKMIDGERVVLRTMEAGEVFGEMAILSPGPRTATVTALETTSVHVVTAETLEREVESMKPWMGTFVRTLARRFRDREEKDRDAG